MSSGLGAKDVEGDLKSQMFNRGQASTPALRNATTHARSRVSWWRGARVQHWAHFLLLPLAGIDISLEPRDGALALARGIFIAFCVLAFGYLLNGVSDRYMDASVRKNPLLEDPSATSYSTVLVVLVVLAALGSFFAPWPVACATAAGITSGIVYSIGPRIKRFPILGTLANVSNFAPLLWVGMTSLAAVDRLTNLTFSFSCLLLQNQLLHEAADGNEDQKGQLITTFLLLGPRMSALISSSLGLALAVVCQRTGGAFWFVGALALVHAIVFPAVLFVRGMHAEQMKWARLAHRGVCLMTGALLFFSSGFKY